MDTLRAANVSFAYAKNAPNVLDGLSYEFSPAALTALTGPSGCGKSTFLYILGLMLQPRSGLVSFGDRDVSGLSNFQRSAFRARNIGFVFQDSELDDFSPILDSVVEPGLYVGATYRELVGRGKDLLAKVGLSGFEDKRPTKISGGQGQRAAVARALVNSPAIILADEPTGNLDRGNAKIILSLLQEAAQAGRTVVVATHDPFVIESCDYVLDVSVGEEM